jgi:hypothetical protein
MNTGPAPADYPRLPGPARFIADIVTDIRAGKSVIVVFPDAAVESGIADAILDDIASDGANAVFCVQSSEPFPTRVITTFGANPVSMRAFDEWEAIVGWAAWHGSWVLIPGWEHRDICEVVDRWPAQVHVCGLPVNDRPKLVLAVRLSDLPRATITHMDTSIVAVHWWWGVLDRLDTETRLAAIAARRSNPIDAAVIAELSGWDLACTDYLARHWNLTTAGVSLAIEAYKRQGAPSSITSSTSRLPKRRGLAAPPSELEQPWRDGLVDRWGHSIRWAPHTLDDKALTQRIWMAHNRILIPHVDEERTYFEELILAKATPRALADLDIREDDIIEIGSLAWLIDTGRIDIGRDHRRRLQAFRDLRNALAHREPVADQLLHRIVGYLDF